MTDDDALIVRDLKVNFYTYDGVVKALDGVDLDVRSRETVGLVGETGCGKSVTVNSVIKLIPMPPGRIEAGRALLRWPVRCPECRGKGCDVCQGSGTRDTCETCGGRKKCVPCRGHGRYKDGKACKACEGTGRCATCVGTGGRYVDLLGLSTKQLREVRGDAISLILQEPMSALNPVLMIAEQIGESFYYHQRRSLVDSTLRALDHAIGEVKKPTRSAETEKARAIARPLGVTLLSILYVVVGILGATAGFALAASASALGLSDFGLAAVPLILLGIADLGIGWGLWKTRTWARTVVVIFSVFGLLASIVGAILSLATVAIPLLAGFAGGAVLDVLILRYLYRPDVKVVFSPGPPAAWQLPTLLLYRSLYRFMSRKPESWLMQFLRRVPVVRRYHRWIDREARARSLEALRMVRIPSPENVLNAYPHELSGGMMQRVVIAIALAGNPKVLIADEPTTALDVTIQSQILRLMQELKTQLGTGIIFITHDLAVIAQVCDRVNVMYAGTIAESAGVQEVFLSPLHPYTRGLIGAIPRPHEDRGRLSEIPGNVPNLVTPPGGCRFHPRCAFAKKEVCSKEKPLLVEVRQGHRVACHMYNHNARLWSVEEREATPEAIAA